MKCCYYNFIYKGDGVLNDALTGKVIEQGDDIIVRAQCPSDRPWCSDILFRRVPEKPETITEYYLWDTFSNEFAECEDCGRWYPIDNMTWVESVDSYVCENCLDDKFRLCDQCGEYYPEDKCEIDAWNCICPHCFESYDYHRCADCNCIISDDDSYWSDRYCDWYCSEHYQDGLVHDYSYKPEPIFHRIGYKGFNTVLPDNSNPLYMGVELEVDEGNDEECVARDYDEGEIYCKHDGSLSDGFEIVSHPMTLEAHKEFDWRGLMETCLDHGYSSHEAGTCGLHVHVNRNYFGDDYSTSDLAAAKMILIFSRFWDNFIVPFSRRNRDQLHWAQKPTDAMIPVKGDTAEDILDKISIVERDRYRAINVRNRGTIEFRVFRGTLKHSTFIATLEFVAGLCEWVKSHSLDETLEVSLVDMLNGAEFKKFDTMRAYIAERHLEINNNDTYEED